MIALKNPVQLPGRLYESLMHFSKTLASCYVSMSLSQHLESLMSHLHQLTLKHIDAEVSVVSWLLFFVWVHVHTCRDVL